MDNIGSSFGLWVPLMKGGIQADLDTGELRHSGIVHDLSLDLQSERVSVIEKALDYLGSQGKFDWEHHEETVGDVTGARRVTPDEAWELFGVRIEKSGTAVWGTVYPPVSDSLASADLKTVRHRLLARARLGYSLEGRCLRKSSGEVIAHFIPRVAICEQAVNKNTVCRLAKSLSAVFDEAAESDEDMEQPLGEQGTLDWFVTAKSVPLVSDEPRRYLVSERVLQLVGKALLPRGERPPIESLGAVLEREARRLRA